MIKTAHLPLPRCTMMRAGTLALAGALMLAGCQKSGKDEDPADRATSDAAVSGALGDQIAVDPGMNGGQGAALGANGDNGSVPPVQRSPEAIAAALNAARQQVGGSFRRAPRPQPGDAQALASAAATAAQVAGKARVGKVDCASQVKYSATWAAKLPADIPIFPRAAVQEAAGTDADGCALRVVNFVTPVSLQDVLDYYYTRMTAQGYGAQLRMSGTDHAMGGSKDGRAYVLYARKQANGLTGVDLVASGK